VPRPPPAREGAIAWRKVKKILLRVSIEEKEAFKTPANAEGHCPVGCVRDFEVAQIRELEVAQIARRIGAVPALSRNWQLVPRARRSRAITGRLVFIRQLTSRARGRWAPSGPTETHSSLRRKADTRSKGRGMLGDDLCLYARVCCHRASGGEGACQRPGASSGNSRRRWMQSCWSYCTAARAPFLALPMSGGGSRITHQSCGWRRHGFGANFPHFTKIAGGAPDPLTEHRPRKAHWWSWPVARCGPAIPGTLSDARRSPDGAMLGGETQGWTSASRKPP
jgi:hypothetical protein